MRSRIRLAVVVSFSSAVVPFLATAAEATRKWT